MTKEDIDKACRLHYPTILNKHSEEIGKIIRDYTDDDEPFDPELLAKFVTMQSVGVANEYIKAVLTDLLCDE